MVRGGGTRNWGMISSVEGLGFCALRAVKAALADFQVLAILGWEKSTSLGARTTLGSGNGRTQFNLATFWSQGGTGGQRYDHAY